jgi:hypothetical protein
VRRPCGFLLCGEAGVSVWPPVEGMAMAMDVEPSRGEMSWLTGRSDHPGRAALASMSIKLVLLPVVTIVGFVTWELLSGPSDAESRRASVSSAVTLAPNAPQPDPVSPPTQATLIAPAETAPVDGLRISSQFWRRAGLGSNAQVSFTLHNGNGYAVKDIEISCAFARRDGSHLTDRTRTIHDTINMKSRRTFARLHVGFININANKAKCSLVAANRI